MGKAEVTEAIRMLRKQQIFPNDIIKAGELAAASGLRVSELNVALYFSQKGDMQQAKLNAGKAADVMTRLI